MEDAESFDSERTGKTLSWLTDEGNKNVLGMKGANALGEEGVGRKGCREVRTSEPTFLFSCCVP